MSDTIDRQAAIDAIERNACNTQRAIDAVIGLPSAQPEKRTEERTETHGVCLDTISRQDAIDALDVLCQEHRYKIPGKVETYSQYNEAWQDALDRAEGSIGNLPSAQPEQDIEFIKLTVRNSNGRPYYSIIYLEVDDNGVGRDFEGYSSYSLDVISDYLKKYFMPSALPETCEGCKHLGKWENEFEYGYPSPCTRCKRRVEDHYER